MAESPNEQVRELSDKIADIREWLVRIDTKVDYLNEVRTTAERAEQKADKALQQSGDNDEEISAVEQRLDKKVEGIKKTAMWAIGLTISSIIAIGGIIVTIAF